jgi:hypothetical protein
MNKCPGEGRYFGSRKAAMTVVEEYRYRLFAPRGGYNQVNRMISVHVAGFNEEPARRANQSKRLPSRCGKLKLNAIMSMAKVIWPCLNVG